MAYQAKKEMDVVTEQPGTKQQVLVEGKKEKKPRLKNEMAEYHQTGLEHPAAQYETYKRPRRDS